MVYLAKAFLVFSIVLFLSSFLAWLFFKKSGEKPYFYVFAGSLLSAIFCLSIAFRPDINLQIGSNGVLCVVSLIPGLALLTLGFVWVSILHPVPPGHIRLTSLKSMKQSKSVKYRKDFLVFAILGYATATCMVLIYGKFTIASTSLILLSAVFAFFVPLDTGARAVKE